MLLPEFCQVSTFVPASTFLAFLFQWLSIALLQAVLWILQAVVGELPGQELQELPLEASFLVRDPFPGQLPLQVREQELSLLQRIVPEVPSLLYFFQNPSVVSQENINK